MPTEQKKIPSTKETPKRNQAIEVIMDSNALFAAMEFQIDIFGELERLLNRRFELVVLSPVRHELKFLAAAGSPKIQKMAAFAIGLTEKCKLVEVPSAETVDDAIIKAAAKKRTPVFTNDAELRKRLRDISVPVIYVRQKSHLAIEGMIQSHV
jgi:rRNA-processing protein FCF1